MKLPALLLTLTLALGSLAAENPAKPAAGEKLLFDGKTLTGWKPGGFASGGPVEVRNGLLHIDMGETLSGVTWTNPVPRTNFELELEGQKVQGSDFFCALTFPVGKEHCTFVLGGWGGAVVGISSIDQMDASENETTKYMKFEAGKWHKVRVRVTPEKIEAWVDAEKMVDLELKDRKISMRPGEIENSEPLGIATYQTSSAFRNIKLRELPAKP